ncbi:MAG: hypothetical protein U5K51_10570 [Flavobacteriaceae bacterium]|nr:hypothetical protein [Flavobacteriaceae bacterium]
MIKLNSNTKKVRVAAISFALVIFFSHILVYHTDLLSLCEPVKIVASDADTNDSFNEVKTLKKHTPQEAFVFLQLQDLSTLKLYHEKSILAWDLLAVDSPPPEISRNLPLVITYLLKFNFLKLWS